MPLDLSPRDRLLVLAPHPDDESLATGALILRALSSGASVKVIFATNGDNNPWPQRWVERRWRIGPEEQKRWGLQRQQEARAAVACLGLPESAASFLNLRDQGTSRLLRERCEETLCRITEEIVAFQPTLCAIPSQHDLHPDHNALHLLWQIAEARAALSPPARQIHYLVHCRHPELAPQPIYLALTPEEQQRKYAAILCHETQMVLSKKRFLNYAKPQERYHLPPAPSAEVPGHRVFKSELHNGELRLTLHLPRRRFGATLHLCGETTDHTGLRSIHPLPLATAVSTARHCTHAALKQATVRIEGREALVTIPLPESLRLARLYAKFQRPTLFLDETGWRSIPLISRDASGNAAAALA